MNLNIKQKRLPLLEEGAHLVFYVFTPYDYLPPCFTPVVVIVVMMVLLLVILSGVK